ncbi:Clavaminate synthase-like protein, partial [Hortaea werneckii]
MEHHYIQPIKDGTLFPFDRESFPRIRPELVTREFFEKSGTFVEPICIPAEWNPRPWEERAGKGKDFDKVAAAGRSPADATADLYPEDFEYDSVRDDGQDKLDMVMPEGLSVRQVCNLVGPEYPLDVIDVKTQNSGAKMNLAKWADYYEEESEDKQIRNVISLEVSQSKLGRLLRRPKVVRDIDLQDQVWPQEETDKGKYPKVQYYCLMSIADSYTDFHIDFGGSSVYYHILKGKKTFFFIPPKPKHLKAYEEWNESPQQNFTFLGNITGECYRVDLKEGDTMLIPSGWIHAVWTPETSLVIGGNFLTRMSYKNQFKVVEIEKANKTPMKFRYPFFQKIMFYTALKYLKEDPLPPSVSQMFYEGKQFHRQQPIWQDFDGRLAAKDPRPEAQNSRYYSQAELEGLPDLALYLYHVVLAVLGLREGISADQMKRMNASIPKGHGEPLEVAKTFALWVAWKTGEPAPAFAHPDALLDTI